MIVLKTKEARNKRIAEIMRLAKIKRDHEDMACMCMAIGFMIGDVVKMRGGGPDDLKEGIEHCIKLMVVSALDEVTG